MKSPLKVLVWACVLVLAAQASQSAISAEPAVATATNTAPAPRKPAPRHEFTRMVGHWAEYADPRYMPFIADAKPDLAQFGFYGAHFWSLAHTPQYNGYPAHLPVQGLKECGAWFAEKNKELHAKNVKVIGHMNVKFLVGDPDGPEGPRGFFKFYRDLWDEKELGPKPTTDLLSMLEVDKDGKLIANNSYSIGGMKEYWACLNNPDWRAVLKAWVRYGIKQGVDGFVANYFYRHDCHCRHCVAGFKQHLTERYNADQLREKFAIADLKGHKFEEIVSWHKPEESTPLRREMLAFSQIGNKRAFDEVFIEHGRSLKYDLMAAQWNHLGNFSQINGDERCLLPGDLWGRNEDYTWYSTGGAACYSDLKAHFLGEGTLQARYIRAALQDKPYTLGKYEHTRIRVTIAELAANGGAPMGFYTRFTEPEAREVIVRYYNFIRELDDVFRGSGSHAEVALLYPRTHVHAGDVAAVEKFKQIGAQLLDDHVLFDVRTDDLPAAALNGYSAVIDPTKIDAAKLSAVLPQKRTQLDAPWTVRLSANRSFGKTGAGGELTLHLVNYDRTEPDLVKNKTGQGAMDEKPIAAKPATLRFVVPPDTQIGKVTAHSPEWSEPRVVETKRSGDVLEIKVPEYLVYCVLRLSAAN
ncbi:MAG: hypothetical protein K8U03_20675 [Planctomycetia bacterium]|nr:hypothetical protein [Planctomycetia bacterium]